MSFENTKLQPETIAWLEKNCVTNCRELLEKPICELERIFQFAPDSLSFSLQECASQIYPVEEKKVKLKLAKVSSFWAQKNSPRFDSSHNSLRLTSGCAKIDEKLKGGFAVGCVTEICGKSSAGKTQICLQLCLTVQFLKPFGGLEGSALYISTEDIFPSRRLSQLVDSCKYRWSHCFSEDQKQAHNLSDCVYVEHCSNFEQLWFLLERKIPRLMGHLKLSSKKFCG
eukprot:Sdes_comp20969_c0_seq3m19017